MTRSGTPTYPDIDVNLTLSEVGGQGERAPSRRYVCCLRIVAWSQQRSRTGNSALQLVRPVTRIVTAGHADIVFYSWLAPACRSCGRYVVKTARRFALGRPRRGSACRVRRPGA